MYRKFIGNDGKWFYMNGAYCFAIDTETNIVYHMDRRGEILSESGLDKDSVIRSFKEITPKATIRKFYWNDNGKPVKFMGDYYLCFNTDTDKSYIVYGNGAIKTLGLSLSTILSYVKSGHWVEVFEQEITKKPKVTVRKFYYQENGKPRKFYGFDGDGNYYLKYNTELNKTYFVYDSGVEVESLTWSLTKILKHVNQKNGWIEVSEQEIPKTTLNKTQWLSAYGNLESFDKMDDNHLVNTLAHVIHYNQNYETTKLIPEIWAEIKKRNLSSEFVNNAPHAWFHEGSGTWRKWSYELDRDVIVNSPNVMRFGDKDGKPFPCLFNKGVEYYLDYDITTKKAKFADHITGKEIEGPKASLIFSSLEYIQTCVKNNRWKRVI